MKGLDVLKLKKRMLIPAVVIIVAISVGTILLTRANDEKALLRKFKLSKSNVVEMVEQLEGIEKGLLNASVTSEYVVLNDGDHSAKVKIPDDQFFLAFAPYINQTHPCVEYNLNSCHGELANQTFLVSIITPSGDIILQEEMVSADNGFVTIWLDKNIEANLTVEYNNLKAKTFISTNKDSNNCLTTPLQLKKE